VPGWFKVNVADAQALTGPNAGSVVRFEDEDAPFEQVGINIRVLAPGQPNGRYHAENLQEDFLVLAGECLVIVDGEEHRLWAWDFVHCPPGTPHIFVGAGDGPCAILMVGSRSETEEIVYSVSELAARFGASVAAETNNPEEAYADWTSDLSPTRLDWPLA
jgi:uncharacterized cupin superfamily protein